MPTTVIFLLYKYLLGIAILINRCGYTVRVSLRRKSLGVLARTVANPILYTIHVRGSKLSAGGKER